MKLWVHVSQNAWLSPPDKIVCFKKEYRRRYAIGTLINLIPDCREESLYHYSFRNHTMLSSDNPNPNILL